MILLNYIYDIYINLEEDVTNFFEWDKYDNILHIKKAPIFKVDLKFMNSIYFNNVKVMDISVLIFNKTETFNLSKINYFCIFTDGQKVLGVKLDKNGLILNKFRLLLEDESEVIQVCNKIIIKQFKYNIISKLKYINNNLTRKENNIKFKLTNLINLSYYNLDFNKISYIYYEYYNKKCSSINKMYNKLIKDINNNFNIKHINLYNELLVEIGK